MSSEYFIAQLLGFSLVVISLAMVIRPKSIYSILHFFENEGALALGGVGKAISGVAILLFYHSWSLSWPVIITIFGWVSVVVGIKMLVFPNHVVKGISQLKNSGWLSVLPLFSLVFGCVLVYFGFGY